MRGFGARLAFAAMACASILGGPHAVVPAASTVVAEPSRRRQRVSFGYDVAPKWRRSKNPPHRRRLRANRLLISRRVRRRHARARRRR